MPVSDLRLCRGTEPTSGSSSETTFDSGGNCSSSASGWGSDVDAKTVHYFWLFTKLSRTLLHMEAGSIFLRIRKAFRLILEDLWTSLKR